MATSVVERLVLAVSEVQEALGLSRSSVYEGIARGAIPSIRVGKRILVPRAALEKLLADAGRQKPAGAQEQGT